MTPEISAKQQKSPEDATWAVKHGALVQRSPHEGIINPDRSVCPECRAPLRGVFHVLAGQRGFGSGRRWSGGHGRMEQLEPLRPRSPVGPTLFRAHPSPARAGDRAAVRTGLGFEAPPN